MEDIIFLMFCLISLININIKGFNSFFFNYMELENTSNIKGIFVWMILFSHNRRYYKKKYYIKYIYIKLLKFFGQKIVSLFLFYSGYGIVESIKKKGINYIKTLPRKGTILFIKFQLILLIFLINNIICRIQISLKQYFLSMIFKKSIGNSNWFAFVIICLYFISFFSFINIKNEKYLIIGVIINNIICFFYIYLVYNFFYSKKIYPVDNILSFVIGLYYSIFQNYLNKIITKNDIYYFGTLSIFILTYYFFINKPNNVYFISITNSLFCLITIIISMKVKFQNEFLKLLNNHSFSIYLLQRVVMNFIYHYNYFENSSSIRFIFIFIAILFMASFFDKYTNFINFLFEKKKNKKNLEFHKLIMNKYNGKYKELEEKNKFI